MNPDRQAAGLIFFLYFCEICHFLSNFVEKKHLSSEGVIFEKLRTERR